MSEITVTRDDQGRTVEARPGDLIILRIAENLTTGYAWEIESADGAVVELEQSGYVESDGAPMGRGGLRVLRFIARAPGIQEVRLQLRRPWDPPGQAIEQFSIRVQVH